MDEQNPEPETVPEWNPLAKLEPISRPLKVSGGRASVVCQKWGGRERLAYEDALTERMLTNDQHGEETVKIGTLRLFAISLTVIGSSGFPDRDGRAMFTGTREQREDDLLALDADTFAEVRSIALEIQPLPRAEEGLEDADEDAGGPNPSPTASTSQDAGNDAVE